MGVEASWLLPAALIGLAAGIWFTRRAVRTDAVRASLLLWGGWLLVPASYSVTWTARSTRTTRWRYLQPRLVLAAMMAATGVWAFVLLDRTPDWLPWLRWVVIALAILVAAVLAVGAHRLKRAATAVVVPAATGTTPPWRSCSEASTAVGGSQCRVDGIGGCAIGLRRLDHGDRRVHRLGRLDDTRAIPAVRRRR